MEWALGITEHVNQLTDLRASLYMGMFSPGTGTLAWSGFVPDLTALEVAMDKLAVDNRFIASADMGGSMTVNGADDGLYAVVHGVPSADRSVEYVNTVQAVCAPGCISQGMEVGMEIAQLAEEITGTPTLFCASMSGAYGSVGWITGFERIQTMEAGEQALMSDSRWLDLIDRKAGSTYTAAPDVTRQMRWRRIG